MTIEYDSTPSSRPAASRPERPTVLLVDDEPLVLRALERMLVRAGCPVVTAKNARDALDLVVRRGADVVVSDISMPGQSGLRLLRDAHIHDPELPVVLLTGGPTLDSAIRAVELGAYRYLTKPVSPDDLISAVTSAWRLRRLAARKAETLALAYDAPPAVASRAERARAFEWALSSMSLLYQPIFEVRTGRPLGHEALPWSREPTPPALGALPDAAVQLDRWRHLARAVRSEAARTLEKHRDSTLFLSIRAPDIEDTSLVEGRSPLSAFADRVVLQLPDREPLGRLSDAAGRVAALRRRGFRIAVDDVGAGPSGLLGSALIPIDVVKLSPALTRGIETNETRQKIVRFMVRLAAEIQVPVVGSGVGTAGERDTLVVLGCDHLQGDLLAPPRAPFPGVAR